MRGAWRLAAVAAATLVSWQAGCLVFSTEDTPAPARVSTDLRAVYVVANATTPSALAFAPDGRVFYTEKNTGRIRVISRADELLFEPFAVVPVNCAGDRGLLGIALHPDFARNGRVYVFYTRSDSGLSTDHPQAVIDNRVVYFEADGDRARAGEIFVASLPAGTSSQRVGGRIAFDSDGKLLVALGDLGDPQAAADDTNPAGKLLRYQDDGTVPADNPAADSPIFARGLRDPRGLCVDPQTGAIFLIDRNDEDSDEIHRLVAGSDGGWPQVVGLADSPAESQYAAAHAGYVDPLYMPARSDVRLAGGSFNPSMRYGPSAHEQYFFAEATGRRLAAAELTADRTGIAQTQTVGSYFPGTIMDVAFTPAGTLYVACENAILRIVPIR
jgi:glucose/arabinose dehydrogenase